MTFLLVSLLFQEVEQDVHAITKSPFTVHITVFLHVNLLL